MDLLSAHGKAMAEFDGRVNAISPGQWDAPTPCTEWTVTDLLNHLVSEQLWVPSLLAGATMAEVGGRFDGDQLGADPKRAWSSAAAAARAAWTADGVLGREVHLSFGDAGARMYGWQMTMDLTVHAWDLARAIGAPADVDEELAESLLAEFRPQLDAMGSGGVPGIFAPPVRVEAGAGPRRRLLALTGRDPD